MEFSCVLFRSQLILFGVVYLADKLNLLAVDMRLDALAEIIYLQRIHLACHNQFFTSPFGDFYSLVRAFIVYTTSKESQIVLGLFLEWEFIDEHGKASCRERGCQYV